jgi:hypothetical protein
MVSAPFSFEVFLSVSDNGVLRLLAHYTDYVRDYDDFLVGGEDQVGAQLCEASSRHPTRFLRLLSTNWADISEGFSNAIMEGVSNYLAHRHGNSHANGTWTPIDEPDAPALASHILDELERHPGHWQLNRAASNALQACAHVVMDTQNASRLVFLAIGFANLREESTIQGDSVDFIQAGIGMVSGHAAESLMILANSFLERSIPFPELLSPALLSYAGSEDPAIRALVLRRLPYLQSRNPELGWEMFHLSTKDGTGLWQTAEPCLYYAYYDKFEKVAPLLVRIRYEGKGDDMETWGRISALAALTGHIDISVLLNDLKAMDNTKAWRGAACVWTHHENIKQHREQCLTALNDGLNANGPHAVIVAQEMEQLLSKYESKISIPIELIRLCFNIFESDSENKNNRLICFNEWLNATSHRDPEQALAATEIYLAYVSRTKSYLYDHENSFTQLMTRLFAEAEEREESDHGEMLQRVVLMQDMLLSLGVDGVNDWLKAAERP